MLFTADHVIGRKLGHTRQLDDLITITFGYDARPIVVFVE